MKQIIATIYGKKNKMIADGLECAIHHVTYAGLVGDTGVMRIINIGGDGKEHVNDYFTTEYDIVIELLDDGKQDEIDKLKEMIFALVEKTKNL